MMLMPLYHFNHEKINIKYHRKKAIFPNKNLLFSIPVCLPKKRDFWNLA